MTSNARPYRPGRATPWVLMAPVILVLGFAFVAPVAWLFRMSLNRSNFGAIVEAFSIDTYAAIVSDSYYLELLGRTLQLSITASLIALAMGYPVAIFITRMNPRFRTLLTVMVASPLLVSAVVRSYGWMVTLGDNGFVNNSLIGLGLISSPIRMVNNYAGVVVGLAESVLPFMFLTVMAGLGKLDSKLDEAAMSLGAPPHVVFWKITLPLSAPALIASFTIGFVLSVSSFVTPTLLGGGRVFLLATEVYDLALVTLDWPSAAALSFLMLAIFLFAVMLTNWLSRRLT